MITVGVDLSSQAHDTAIAVVEWGSERSRATSVVTGVDDEMILEAASAADAIGIAAPFGWPDPFFELLRQHREGRIDEPRRAASVSGRDGIMYRTTERRVREWLGLKLMPSTSNMLGSTVLRCAGLLSRMGDAGVDVSKAGNGRVVEVYAPASLMAWGLHEQSYKNQSAARAKILEQVVRRLSLDLGPYLSLCVESDDATDALVASMTARAVALGNWRAPLDEEEIAHASTEGWICVPSGTVWSLAGALPTEVVSEVSQAPEPDVAPEPEESPEPEETIDDERVGGPAAPPGVDALAEPRPTFTPHSPPVPRDVPETEAVDELDIPLD